MDVNMYSFQTLTATKLHDSDLEFKEE